LLEAMGAVAEGWGGGDGVFLALLVQVAIFISEEFRTCGRTDGDMMWVRFRVFIVGPPLRRMPSSFLTPFLLLSCCF
jgi:hypothetical protein